MSTQTSSASLDNNLASTQKSIVSCHMLQGRLIADCLKINDVSEGSRTGTNRYKCAPSSTARPQGRLQILVRTDLGWAKNSIFLVLAWNFAVSSLSLSLSFSLSLSLSLSLCCCCRSCWFCWRCVAVLVITADAVLAVVVVFVVASSYFLILFSRLFVTSLPAY